MHDHDNATLLDDWARDQRRRGVLSSSIATRRVHLVVIANSTVEDSVLDITIDEVQDILDHRQGRDGGPLADRTRYCYLSSLTDFFHWAKRAGHVTDRRMDEAQRPKLRQLLPRPMPDEERQRAFHHCRNDPRMTLWLLLASGAGLRVSEIAGLEASDVIRGEPWHLHVIGKGRKERYVPIHAGVQYALEHYGIPRRGFLFHASTGKPYSGQSVSVLMCSYLNRLGIESRPHQLRHWFGTELCGNGVELRVVQELMGHASPVTTAGYTKVRPAAAQVAVAGLML